MEAAENGRRETAVSRARAGSLYRPLSGIHFSLRPICLCSEAEEQEVTVLESESEAVSEEEVEVEDCWRFFRPCRCINLPFTHLGVSTKGEVAVAEAALETEDKQLPGGAVVG